MSGVLGELCARHAADPDQPGAFYTEALEALLCRRETADLRPELLLAAIGEAPLEALTMDGWVSIWKDLCAWLSAAPRPGGSWRIRAARAAAARDAGDAFGAAFCARRRGAEAYGGRVADTTPVWTGSFLSPWAPPGQPHLEDFAPEERAEFLALASPRRLAASLAAWEAQLPQDAIVARELGLCPAEVARRRRALLAAARTALA